MACEEFKTPLDAHLDHEQKKNKRSIPHFPPLNSSQEQETSSVSPNTLDKGKGLAFSGEEERHRARAIEEHGEPVPRAFNLSSKSTRDHPILPGGMKGFMNIFNKGETSGIDKNIGRRVGEYRLAEFLGKGGFANVYLGEYSDSKSKLKKLAAVKLLQMDRVNPKDLEQVHKEFRKEAGTLAALNHENIVRVLEFGTKGEVPFLVMEYAPHGTLHDAHPKGTCLSPMQVVAYVDQIADALDYLHSQKVMHLDIKPENFFLVKKPNGEIKVLLGDFGLAQTIHNTLSQIMPDKVAGTAPYMAPEYMVGEQPPSPACDQYALGAMVYEWLSGKRPIAGPAHLIAERHLYNVRPEPLYGNISGISLEIEEVVFKALERDPKDRYPNVKTFAEALKQACGDSSPSGEREKPTLQEEQNASNQVQNNDEKLREKEEWYEHGITIRGRSSDQMTPRLQTL